MKRLILLLGTAATLTVSAQNLQWANSVSGSGASDVVNDIVTDNNKNVYATGSFLGTVDFDPGSGVFNLTAASTDIFVQKLDSLGNFVWAVSFGGSGTDVGLAIAYTSFNEILVGGYYDEIADLDPSAGTMTVGGSGENENAFVVNLSATGAFVQSINFPCPYTSADKVYDIVCESSGSFLIAGEFGATMDIDPSVAGTLNVSSSSVQDAFIIRYSAQIQYQNHCLLSGNGTQAATRVALAPGGDVLASGYFDGNTDFDPSGATYLLSPASTGANDAFIARLNNSLSTLVYAHRFGNSSIESASGLGCDASGNAYLGGIFRGTVDFDPGAGTFNLSTPSSTTIQLFFLKLTPVGTLIWAKQVSGSGAAILNDMRMSSSGNFTIAGSLNGSVDVDPGSATTMLTSNGAGSDFLALEYDSSGAYIRAEHAGDGAGSNICYAAISTGQKLFVAGSFSSTVDFDPSSGTANLTATISDGFIACYSSTASVSVAEFTTSETFSLFPNPASNTIYINTGSVETGSILDINGKEVVPVNVNYATTINISDLAPGIYFLVLHESRISRMFVKQ